MSWSPRRIRKGLQETCLTLSDFASTHESAGAVHLTSNAKACEVAFVKGDRPGIRAVGLEAVDEAAVDEILARAKADNLEILSDVPLVDCAKRAVRIRTPFGPILEVHTAVERQQHRGPNLLSNGHHVRRLDHVNLRVERPPRIS